LEVFTEVLTFLGKQAAEGPRSTGDAPTMARLWETAVYLPLSPLHLAHPVNASESLLGPERVFEWPCSAWVDESSLGRMRDCRTAVGCRPVS
jgi:hypothetical protein